MFQIKGAVNVPNCLKKPVYYLINEQKNVFVKNCLLAPVFDRKKNIRGVIELSDHQSDGFSFDDEYYVILLSQFLGYVLEFHSMIAVITRAKNE